MSDKPELPGGEFRALRGERRTEAQRTEALATFAHIEQLSNDALWYLVDGDTERAASSMVRVVRLALYGADLMRETD